MTVDLNDPALFTPTTPAMVAPAKPKPHRHRWMVANGVGVCSSCGKSWDASLARRNTNNRKRGTSDELRVAEIVGGRKVGPLGLPWDVEVAAYLRLQAKKLDRWPSLNEVVKWLDGIPAGPELRGVTLADTPGPGRRTRRLIVFDLAEFAGWHGRSEK